MPQAAKIVGISYHTLTTYGFHGVEIFEYPALVHAKVIVSDDRAIVGTLNLDAWAMFRNPEHGLLGACSGSKGGWQEGAFPRARLSN